MPIDPDKALGAVLPPVESAWTDQDVLLYQLAIGAGADDADLPYVYERGLRVLPTFGVVATAGGGLLRDLPGVEVDLAAVLHAGQELEVHAPLAPAGTLRTERRLAHVLDKGSAAVLVFEGRSHDPDGVHVLTTRSSVHVRGEGGFGGPRGTGAEAPPRPGRDPDQVVRVATSPRQALLYRLTGDRNPLHADPAFARAAGFDRPILHGLCTYAMVGKAVVDTLLDGDPAAVASYGTRFTGSVYPGETLVVALWREGATVWAEATTAERDRPVLGNTVLTVRT